MMSIFTTILAVAGLGLVAWLVTVAVVSFYDSRAIKLTKAAEQLDKFYANALKLVQDESTPESIVDFIGRLSTYVGTRKMAWMFTILFLKAMKGQQTYQPRTEANENFSKALISLTEEKSKVFAEMYMAGVIASACSDTLFADMHFDTWKHALHFKQKSTASVSQSSKIVAFERPSPKDQVRTTEEMRPFVIRLNEGLLKRRAGGHGDGQTVPC